MSNESLFIGRFKRHWLSGVLFLIPFVLWLLSSLLLHLPELYQHLLLTLTAVMGIHVLDRLFLIKDTEDALERLVHDVRHDIGDQTGSLLSMSKSLEVMDRCGIVQIYPSRVDAASDIRSDLIDASNTKVRLLGISLNDFVQGIDQTLLEAWTTIQAFVHGHKPINDRERGLDIRCLIIDPLCFGATLRSEAESETSAALTKRLEQDVWAAARDLKNLTAAANPEKTGVSFECRLYRLPPILFLCWIDPVCYVQQYHFWSSRDNRTPTPVLKFRSLPASAATYPYHKEMEHHFDWIWDNASLSVDEYLDGATIGTERGMHQCGAVNVYTNPSKACDRIVHLLTRARKNISIQGISLNSYFKVGALREVLSTILEEGNADVEVLLLNPESRQAKLRSYRERLFESSEQSYNDYLEKGDHEKSDLYHDTNRTIENILHMVAEIRRRKGDGWAPRLTVGLYDSAPSCFVLRIDDHILVEQYHYGKIVRETRAILGKDMPLVEYRDAPSPLYEDQSDALRRPFGLLVDHFRYALAQARILDVGMETAQRGDSTGGATSRS